LPRNPKRRNRPSKRKSSPPGGFSVLFASGLALFADPQAPALRWTKLLIGIALLPLCWVLLETFLVLLRADTLAGDYWRSREAVFFGLGVSLSLVLFFFARGRILTYLYVLGHEYTHALFVWLCRGRVNRVHVSARGGHILTNRNNFLISLSPYFFPFYSAVAILAWVVYGWIVAEHAAPDPVWLYGLIGFTWAFHLAFTVWMVLREQPDVEQNGRLFSFTVIFAANVLLISAMLVVASPTASFRSFFASLWENARTFFPRLAESAAEVYAAMPW